MDVKKIITLLMTVSFVTSLAHGAEQDDKYNNQVSMADSSSNYMGFSADDSVAESIATSMVGWGVGMAIAIGVLSLVIKPSNAEHVHSTETPGAPQS